MRLIIAEKPSLGKAIAAVIGIVKSQDGYVECKDDTIVTWCIGHLLEQAPPHHYGEQYKIWRLDDLPLFPDKWILLPVERTEKQLDIVINLIKKADIIVNAGDPDREGNLLVNEVIEYANASQAQIDNALRILINDLNPTAIKKALQNLEPNHEHLNSSNAALSRSRADWLLGMNMSRACTLLAKQQGYATLFAIGRVQTPTLQIVVQRDLAIAQFTPKPFFNVTAQFSHNDIEFSAKWQVPDSIEDKRCLDPQVALTVSQEVQLNPAIVTQYETKQSVAQPPLPFSLRTLQEYLSKKYGYGVKQTLDLAQSLYETHKLTSYPRTDKPYLSDIKRSEISTIIENLASLSDSPLAEFAKGADQTLSSPCWNDKKLEGAAHTAIIPTLKSPDLSRLSVEERNAYDAIARRYLAQFYLPAIDDNTVIEMLAGTHTFKTTGKVELEKGWRTVLSDEKSNKPTDEPQALPALGSGEMVKCVTANSVEKKTTPPKPFTEGTLVTAMSTIAKDVTNPAYKAKLKETAGLGTEATRANIIDALKEHNFLIPDGKNIKSTKTGKMLILSLPNSLKDPALTAIWEQQLDVIEQGEYSLEDFEAKIHSFISTLISNFKSGETQLTLPPNTAPRCKCGGWINPSITKKDKPIWRCTHCDQRSRDNKGQLGKPILKIGKLEI